MKKSLVLSALILSGTAAVAQGSADTATTVKTGPHNNPDEIVCIREEAIGSRLGARRVCRTRAEWAEHRRQYQQSIERAQQQMQTSGE
jgi:hypothetical protein